MKTILTVIYVSLFCISAHASNPYETASSYEVVNAGLMGVFNRCVVVDTQNPYYKEYRVVLKKSGTCKSVNQSNPLNTDNTAKLLRVLIKDPLNPCGI